MSPYSWQWTLLAFVQSALFPAAGRGWPDKTAAAVGSAFRAVTLVMFFKKLGKYCSILTSKKLSKLLDLELSRRVLVHIAQSPDFDLHHEGVGSEEEWD